MQAAGTRRLGEEGHGLAFEAFEREYPWLDGRLSWPEAFWGDGRVCDDLGPLSQVETD